MPGPGATQYVVIDGFLIDCSLSESHTFDSDVTEYPVESGSNIVDNIRPLPIEIEMEGLVTNTPIGIIAGSRNAGTKPVEDAYDLLQKIRDRREPITIQTSLRTYENMALKNLNIPRSSGGAQALNFRATFHQVQLVENVRTIRVSTPIATTKGSKTVTKTPVPLDMRQIIIDTKNLMWWDPDVGSWRAHASYEEAEKVHEETGFTVVTNISKWHLFRGPVQSIVHTSGVVGAVGQEEAHDDPFDTVRFVPPHPVRQQLIVTLNQCVLEGGFFIRKQSPGGFTNSTSNTSDFGDGTLRKRTL